METNKLSKLLRRQFVSGWILFAVSGAMALGTMLAGNKIFDGLDRSARIVDEQIEVTIAQMESTERIAEEMSKTVKLYATLIIGLEASLGQIAEATDQWSSALMEFAKDAEEIGKILHDVATYLPIEIPTGIKPKWDNLTLAGVKISYPVDFDLLWTSYLTREKQKLNKTGQDLIDTKKTLNNTAENLSRIATFLRSDTLRNVSSSTVQSLDESADTLKGLAVDRLPAVRKGLEEEKVALEDMRKSVSAFNWIPTFAFFLMSLFFLHSLNGARICRAIAEQTELVHDQPDPAPAQKE